MLFELLIVPLYCAECEEKTEHLVKFVYYNPAFHNVIIEYYCQGCFDLAYETGTTYPLYRKKVPFYHYKELCDKYGEIK